ncbi:uncharacterized protein LOC144422172 [Styela clava]
MNSEFENTSNIYSGNSSYYNETRAKDFNRSMDESLVSEIVYIFYALVMTYIIITLTIDIRRRKNVSGNRASKNLGTAIKIVRYIFAWDLLLVAIHSGVEKYIVEMYFPELCSISHFLYFFCTSTASIFSYLILWLRQRLLYQEQAMKHLTTCSTRFLSIASLILVISLPSTLIFLSPISAEIGMTERGCGIVRIRVKINYTAFWISYGVWTIFTQMVLLYLYLLPIFKHKENAGNASRELMPVLKKAAIAASLCFLSDTMATIFIVLFTSKLALLANQIFNLIMTIMAFVDWKRMLLPFCFKESVASN